MIAFAPLQGYTDHIYRNIHARTVGGVDEYYTPFIRWEHGGIRNKDLRDVDPANNTTGNIIPQVIAKNRDEFANLCDTLQQMGWKRIDLNMGCPFPMQVHSGRGAGLLSHEQDVAEIFNEIKIRKEVTFSAKMRLGWNNPEEVFRLCPILNESHLCHITLHPRLSISQYKGTVDDNQFLRFYEECTRPIVYNGDITSVAQIKEVRMRFPNLKGIMIGRGLLSRPTIAKEYRDNIVLSNEDILKTTLIMHNELFIYAQSTLQGETQILNRMRAFWEYQESLLPKKSFKKLTKSTTLRSYHEALASL